jgi:hypothetical protein
VPAVTVPYPEDEYLLLVGKLAYAVTYLEGMILFDLPDQAHHLPPTVSLAQLAEKTTGQIAKSITQSLVDVPDPKVNAWLDQAAKCLDRAAKIRNAVLHARGDRQR